MAVDPGDTTREFVILTTGRISKSRLKEMLRYAQHDVRCWVNTYIIANKKDIDARINVFLFV